MKLTFTRLFSRNKALRDNVVERVESLGMPEIGKPFEMTAPARDEGDFRYIRTAPVTCIMIFTESGSIYSVRKEP